MPVTQLVIVDGVEQFVERAGLTDGVATGPSLPRWGLSPPGVDAPAGSPVARPAARANASEAARRFDGLRLTHERGSPFTFEPGIASRLASVMAPNLSLESGRVGRDYLRAHNATPSNVAPIQLHALPSATASTGTCACCGPSVSARDSAHASVRTDGRTSSRGPPKRKSWGSAPSTSRLRRARFRHRQGVGLRQKSRGTESDEPEDTEGDHGDAIRALGVSESCDKNGASHCGSER